jgi:hypothetical protein
MRNVLMAIFLFCAAVPVSAQDFSYVRERMEGDLSCPTTADLKSVISLFDVAGEIALEASYRMPATCHSLRGEIESIESLRYIGSVYRHLVKYDIYKVEYFPKVEYGAVSLELLVRGRYLFIVDDDARGI